MKTIKKILNGFAKFGRSIAVVVNSILLSAVYVLGVGLTSMSAKLAKKSFLDLKLSKKKDSYWSDLNLKKKPIEEYHRQF